jgi:predicted nucleic acid-binding protein
VEEYLEILSNKTTSSIAGNVISTILNQRNIELINPHYRFGLIQSDIDDNKFVDCAIVANAEFLVSNDSHFRVLEQIPFPKVNILRLQSFSRMIEGYHWNEDISLLNEPEIEYNSGK